MGVLYDNEKNHRGIPWLSMLVRRWPRVKWDKVTPYIIVLGLILTFLNLRQLLVALDKVEFKCSPGQRSRASKTFAIHGKRVDSGYLFHVMDTFHAVGYERVNVSDNWDVLWSHDYPFTILKDRLQELKPGQKVNHFPGSGFITNKMNLATSEYSFVPRAFQLPKGKEDLLQYAGKNPSTMFVQKSNSHRGIKIEQIENLDLNKSGSFVQTYISNPFLIDGHKFDIGVYVIVTSLEPLRVYRYTGDTLFRFCPVTYHPFDPEVLDKYVVGDDYLPLWKVNSLQHAYSQGFSMQEAFDAFIRKAGKDPARLWSQVDSAIRTIYLTKEAAMIETWRQYEKKRNFFELVRFDFVIDEDLNIFLMEVNMSPNLSSAHFPSNRLLYEQVLFSTFLLVGISNSLVDSGTRSQPSRIISSKHVYLNQSICEHCSDCSEECQLCPTCTSEEEVQILKEAYLEHLNKMDTKRIFPRTGDMDKEGMTSENKWMTFWYNSKCKHDPSWCSN